MINKPAHLLFDTSEKRVMLNHQDPDFFQEPYSTYALLHAHCPTFFWQDYGHWCFGGFEAVHNLLRDRRFGRENHWGPPLHATMKRSHLTAFDRIESGSLLEREPPAHTRLRTLVNRAFVSRAVERLTPRITQLAHDLIDQFPRDQPFDLLPAFATPIPLIVICELLGVPAQEAPHLLQWSHAMCEMYVPSRSFDAELKANAACVEFGDFLKSHIKHHRHRGTDDLLASLIAVRDSGEKLSDDELISTCVLLLNAGHEATVHQTGNAVKTILQYTDYPHELFATPESSQACLEEILRFDAPLHMFTRFAYEMVDFGNGVIVHEGDRIGLLLGMANHDPEIFADPEKFNPHREANKNVSFGAGIHFCLGAPLARLELQTSLKILFDKAPSLKLVGEPLYRNSFHFHGLERLMVTV